MLDWFKRKQAHREKWVAAVQIPNEAFPLPKGTKLRAKEEILLALPKALILEDETIGSIILCEDDAEFGIHAEKDVYLIRLKDGMTICLTRSSEAILLADDDVTRSRKVEILRPSV